MDSTHQPVHIEHRLPWARSQRSGQAVEVSTTIFATTCARKCFNHGLFDSLAENNRKRQNKTRYSHICSWKTRFPIIFLFISHFILELVPPPRIKLRSATRYPAVERFNIIKRDFSEQELVFGVKNSANAPLVSMNPVQNFAALLFFVCLWRQERIWKQQLNKWRMAVNVVEKYASIRLYKHRTGK